MKHFLNILFIFFASFANAQNDLTNELDKLYASGEYEKMIILAQKIISNKKTDAKLKANAYSKMAGVYRKKGEFAKAQTTCLKLTEFAETITDEALKKKILMLTFNDLGAISSDMQLKTESYNNFEKALALSREINYTVATGKFLNNLGENYAEDKNYSKAKQYFDESLQIAEQIKDTASIISRYTNLADIYIAQDNYTKALAFLQKANEFAQNPKFASKRPFVAYELARAYLYKTPSEAAKAIEYAQIADKYFTAQNATQYKMYTHLLYSEIYEKQNETQKALSEYKKYENLKDSLTGTAAKNKFQSLQIQFETEKKDNKIANLSKAQRIQELEIGTLMLKNESQKQQTEIDFFKKDNEISKLKINEIEQINQNTQKTQKIQFLDKENQAKALLVAQQANEIQKRDFLVIGLCFVGFVLALVGYLFYKQKQLKAKNFQMELEQKMLLSQMNPHFMFNMLASIQNFVLENNTKQSVYFLGKFAKLNRQVLEYSRENFISLKQEIQLLENYLELQKIRLADKFDYKITLQDIHNELLIPPMFAQPFIENSLEHGILHSTEKGFLEIIFRQNSQKLILEITDNGVGLAKSKLLRNKQKEDSKSLAMQITQERLLLLNQKFAQIFSFSIQDEQDENQEVIGTSIKLELPLQLDNTKHILSLK